MTIPAWSTKILGMLIISFATLRIIIMSLGIQLDSIRLSSLLAFIMTGLSLQSLSDYRQGKRDWPSVLLPISTMSILILMTTLLLFRILDQGSAFDSFFSQTFLFPGLILGEPTTYTMINFLFIATACLGAVYNEISARFLLPLTSLIIITTISLSIFTNLEAAMPPSTIALFLMTGMQMMLIISQKESV